MGHADGQKCRESRDVPQVKEYGLGLLQRLHRLPSDTLIYDLQYQLRRQQCNRNAGFDIGIIDNRYRGDNRQPRAEQPIVSRNC